MNPQNITTKRSGVRLPREPFPVNELSKYLPKRNGKQINRATVWRWISYGLRGVAPLETFVVGGRRFVTRAAVLRFLDECEQASGLRQDQQVRHKRSAKTSAASLTILRQHGIIPSRKMATA
jgi:hypothetical protein